MTKEIRNLMIDKGITQAELAEKLEVTQPTLSKKFKLDNWRESDLENIASVCGCKFVGKFIEW